MILQGESECLFPEDLWSRVFGAHFGTENGYKTMGIQCPILSNNRYQLLLGAHWRTKLLCSKMFGTEQQRDSPRVQTGKFAECAGDLSNVQIACAAVFVSLNNIVLLFPFIVIQKFRGWNRD